jgi:hypothetical protein
MLILEPVRSHQKVSKDRELFFLSLRIDDRFGWVMRGIWAFFAEDEDLAFCVGFSHRQMQVSEMTDQES